jgi:hypothetical protein
MAENSKSKLGPSVPTGHSLGEFTSYQDASDLVEKLIAGELQANKISIIGKDPVLVERVRSRLGYGRVALSGAVTGLWLGILVALLAGSGVTTSADGQMEFVPQDFGAVVIVAAGIGMFINIMRFAASKTKRGFLSSQMPIASRYQVIVPEADAPQALKILSAGTSE